MTQKSMKCFDRQTILIGLDGPSFTIEEHSLDAGRCCSVPDPYSMAGRHSMAGRQGTAARISPSPLWGEGGVRGSIDSMANRCSLLVQGPKNSFQAAGWSYRQVMDQRMGMEYGTMPFMKGMEYGTISLSSSSFMKELISSDRGTQRSPSFMEGDSEVTSFGMPGGRA